MASNLVRFSVTMPEDLLGELDDYAKRRGTRLNRSEALRDIVRERLVDDALSVPDELVAGSITMVYDHHTPGLAAQLDKIQHRHHTEVISTMHVHLDHDTCLEIIAVHGQGRTIANMADCMLGLRGVRQGKLTCVEVAHQSEHDEGHEHHHS